MNMYAFIIKLKAFMFYKERCDGSSFSLFWTILVTIEMARWRTKRCCKSSHTNIWPLHYEKHRDESPPCGPLVLSTIFCAAIALNAYLPHYTHHIILSSLHFVFSPSLGQDSLKYMNHALVTFVFLVWGHSSGDILAAQQSFSVQKLSRNTKEVHLSLSLLPRYWVPSVGLVCEIDPPSPRTGCLPLWLAQPWR